METEGRLAVSVEYIPDCRSIKITLDSGYEHLVMVDCLQMQIWDGKQIRPLVKPTNDQLADVKVWGGGGTILFPSIDQLFDVDKVTCGVFGDRDWMQRLSQKIAIAA